MEFTVNEFRDLIRILEQQPSWRTELRRWVLTDDILELPQIVRELAETQRRTEANLGQLAGRMGQLTERMDQLTERVDSLVQNVSRLADVQHQMGIDLGRLKGSDLERRYRERAPAYFHRLIRRPHALSADELVTLIEDTRLQGHLSEDEADALFQADVIVRGRHQVEGTDLYLVVEVSWGIGLSDVQRAAERARLLARLGTPALPVVAGTWVTPDAQEAAEALQVWQVTNGHAAAPDVD